MTVKQPAGLSEEAKKYWPVIIDLLEGQDILDSPPVLLAYCENFAQWKYNLQKVVELGPVVRNGTKLSESPYQAAADRLQRLMAGMLTKPQETIEPPPVDLDSDQDLNKFQRAFIREWVVSNNGTQAAIKAGYSEKSAASQASALLKNPKIKRHIWALEREISRAAGITVELVSTGLLVEARGEGPDTNSSARTSAWQLLAKLGGLFKEDNAQQAHSARVLDNMDPTALMALEQQLQAESQERRDSQH
jgi:hypothetical protein